MDILNWANVFALKKSCKKMFACPKLIPYLLHHNFLQQIVHYLVFQRKTFFWLWIRITISTFTSVRLSLEHLDISYRGLIDLQIEIADMFASTVSCRKSRLFCISLYKWAIFNKLKNILNVTENPWFSLSLLEHVWNLSPWVTLCRVMKATVHEGKN